MAGSKELEANERKYKSKVYNDKFRAKHADKLKQKIVCEVCNNPYTYYTKSKHMKTKRHLKASNPPIETNQPTDNVKEVNYVV